MNILKTAKSYTRTSLNASLQVYRAMTNRMRVLPDFLIIGGQRCGTSSLYYYLTEHPGIVSAFTKEPHFFDEHFAKGAGWYRTQFPTTLHKDYVKKVLKQDFITGEGTPYYILHPHVPKRASEIVPQAKIIALLRNPADRAYSQYWIEKTANFETLSFEEAIDCEQERLADELERMLEDENYYSYNYRHFSYLTRGIYVDQLQNWMRYYPREQLLILRSEDLYSDPQAVLKQTLEFLGVKKAYRARSGVTEGEPLRGQPGRAEKEYKNYRRPSKKGYRKKEVPPKMDPEMRKRLIEYFAPHNARLYDFLGIDLGWDK